MNNSKYGNKMTKNNHKEGNIVRKILAKADVEINGSRDWDIQVNNPAFYSQILAGGCLALGESYMEGLWDCKSLDKFFYYVLSVQLDNEVRNLKELLFDFFAAKLKNFQSKSKAYEVGEKHYDIGNELYKNMLDSKMVYTCGYWKNADSLEGAQKDKLDLVCRKIYLKEGMSILDIGCGWGSFAKFAAENYGAHVTGITISKEQVRLGGEKCKNLPVEIRLQDYRDLNEKFDAIVSLGMFEHVGPRNYRTYMKTVNKCLKSEGLFLLQTIGSNKSVNAVDPWIDKYIFPNAVLPSAKQITSAAEGLFVMEDWHNFGLDYDRTLMAWHENFQKNWKIIQKENPKYDEKFNRMWSYYLLSCAGGFRARKDQLWQIVYSKEGIKEGYNSLR